jgi:hypothetical protein
MARFFAYRMQSLGGEDLKKQISKGYELALFKPITPAKEMVFEKLYMNAYKRFRDDEVKMKQMAGNHTDKQTPTTAALVVVAGAMMNMDEFITKN